MRRRPRRRDAARPPPETKTPVALAGATGGAVKSKALDKPSNTTEAAEFQHAARWLAVPDGFDAAEFPIIAVHWFGISDRAVAA
jgi:hypothetical protein